MATLFLKIDGIPGESLHDKHKAEIEIDSFSWGASHESSAGSGTGSSAGRCHFQSLHLTAKMDKAYPELMALVCSGDHKPTALLTGIKMGKTVQEYLKIELKEVFCTSASVGGSDGQQVVVNYSFDANKVKWQYAPQKADGSLDSYVTKTWDLKSNKE